MIALTPVSLNSVAVIGAHCDDIAIAAGATLMEVVRDNPDVVVHALVLSGGGTEREVEEKNAFAAICLVTGAEAYLGSVVAPTLLDGEQVDERLSWKERCSAIHAH